MQNRMVEWFFMRPGLDTFRLQPDKHARYLFGEKDRRQRDHLLQSLEEAAYSQDGYKASIFGDFGLGKTHLCNNLVYEISRRKLNFLPVYVKCSGFKKKEPFSTLFREMVFRHSVEEIQSVATEYQRRALAGDERPLSNVIHSADIAHVMSMGLTVPNPVAVRNSMRWLAGEPKISTDAIGGSLKPQLTDSIDFGDVMRGLSHMFIQILGRVPLYIVDEAERFENIGPASDTYFEWLAAIRELTEIPSIALIFMIGAANRDRVPAIFMADEVVRRIGVTNYIDFRYPGKEDLRGFLLEQLQTTIRKGAVPEKQRGVMEPEALDETIPSELLEITGGDPKRLEAYPFEPDAFEQFVSQIATGELAQKPSEAQDRLQKAARRAMGGDKRTITTDIVENVVADVF